jgi:hypothetical protein
MDLKPEEAVGELDGEHNGERTLPFLLVVGVVARATTSPGEE